VALETIDASGCFAMPGLIDPHVHLIGGNGELAAGRRGTMCCWSTRRRARCAIICNRRVVVREGTLILPGRFPERSDRT
jgi:hypothetical protein